MRAWGLAEEVCGMHSWAGRETGSRWEEESQRRYSAGQEGGGAGNRETYVQMRVSHGRAHVDWSFRSACSTLKGCVCAGRTPTTPQSTRRSQDLLTSPCWFAQTTASSTRGPICSSCTSTLLVARAMRTGARCRDRLQPRACLASLLLQDRANGPLILLGSISCKEGGLQRNLGPDCYTIMIDIGQVFIRIKSNSCFLL